MKPFLSQCRLALTPLTPIHIGCDQDFEPTNYLIEDGVLYGFEPSRASLPEHLRKQLQTLGLQADLRGIQNFFRTNARYFKPHASTLIPVASGIARQFGNSLGKAVQNEANGNAVFNKLTIERCSHNPYTGLPFIPGSSFKGAVRTAIVDSLNQDRLPERGENSSNLEKRLLQGDFHTSPLRLLKIADLMPTGELAHEIRYAVNRKKHQVMDKNGNEVQAKGPAARKETIAPGQFRALEAGVALHHPDAAGSKDMPVLRYDDMRKIARLCNRFYRPRLNADLQVIEQRQFAAPDWIKAFDALLDGELRARLDRGDAFLINLGRYGGAESKTLNGDGVAEIEIMQGKGMRPVKQSFTKTLWLAADTDSARSDMQPYGWALVEIDPQEDLPALRKWCLQQGSRRTDMSVVRAGFAAERQQAEQERQRLLQERLAQQAEAEADARAEQARLAALAVMSDNSRKVTLLQEKLRAHHDAGWKKQKIGEAFYNEINQLLKDATSNAWTSEERTAFRECLTEWAPKTIDVELRKSKLKDLLKQL